MESIAIVDCGSGNLRSAAKAFERAAAEAGRNVRIVVTSDPEIVRSADRVALPGQGAFAAVLRGVESQPGLREALEEVAMVRRHPFLGICVGMQLMATRGLEHGVYAGFGWIPGEVVPLTPSDPSLKVPHMGWNDLLVGRSHPLFAGVEAAPMYFTHSFALFPSRNEDVAALVDHGGAVVAAVARDNIAGVQFHPEKSQSAGLRLLANFLDWRP